VKKAQQQAESLGMHHLPVGDFVTGLQNNLREAAGPVNMPKMGASSWDSGNLQYIHWHMKIYKNLPIFKCFNWYGGIKKYFILVTGKI
jgi:hypothetical protein